MPTLPLSGRRPAPARRRLPAVLTAAFLLFQHAVILAPVATAQTRRATTATTKAPSSGVRKAPAPTLNDPAALAVAAPAELFLSEYIEGSSNNKALEIYNGTGASVTMGAPNNYVVQVYSNGATTATNTTALTGTVVDGDVFVIAHSSANATILGQADQTSTNINFNGNDAVVLRKGGAAGTIIDVIGQIGNDPGSTGWGTDPANTTDNTIRRKNTVCAGDPNGSDAFNPATEWDGFNVDTFSGLGAHTTSCGGGDAAPTVSSTTPANNATNVAVNSNVTVTFSEPVNVSGSSFTISCGTSGTHTYALTGSSASYTLNPDTDFANSETCTVTVVANQVADQDASDPPDTMASNHVFSFSTVIAAGACGDPYTPVFQIQGSSTSSPMAGSTVNTEAVVTADFQLSTQQSGFYMQDPGGDGNTATSDGIFVFQSPMTTNVSVGDRVRVTARVVEFNTMTEMDNIVSLQICSTGNTPPLPVAYDLPEPVLNDLERVEGMLVTFPEALTVTGNNLLGRFGEVMLSSDGRLFQQNSFDRPNTPGALARAELNARRQIMLDDASSVQNPNPIPYIGADNTLRAGDTVSALTGVIDYGLTTTNGTTRDYRVQPTGTPTFARANPRPAAPANVGGNLKVASSNVLNYFNGDGAGGGFPTERGATTQAEFTRQRDKIISALTTMNADVLGVIEVENDGGGAQSALQDLVNGMNAATAPGTYVGLHSPNPGTDAIQNAIIYKPASVTPVGTQVNDVNAAWGQARAPLAQTFQHNGNYEKFTFIVNHFTSKGCSASDTGIDADAGDGQGCDNGQRKLQAERLLVFIQDRKTASGDPDVLSMGDYNAYGEEDPMYIMEQDANDTLADGSGGLVSESKRFVPQAERYSYQFDAAFGELDHALATKSMNDQVSGATIWHINADEPTVIDYNTEFKPQDLYTPTPYRSSDHDPLVVGLSLNTLAPQAPGAVIISEFRFRGPGPDGVGGVGPVSGGGDGSGPAAPGTAQDNDEFVELYNNTDSDITVATLDGSAGWAVVAADGVTRFIVPNGTVIRARGHFLGVNIDGYSLDAYGGPDQVLLPSDTSTPTGGYQLDIPDGSGIALFGTADPNNYTLSTRLDAAGYSTVAPLYREGAGFPAPGAEATSDLEYSFVRRVCVVAAAGCGTGRPKDTTENANDFVVVNTDAAPTTIGPKLGAPGPEGLTSPVNGNAGMPGALVDPSVSASQPPNRVRSFTEHPSGNGTYGTLSIRRTITNNTGSTVRYLSFRIIEITTRPVPPGTADLRALDSYDPGNEPLQVTVNGQPVDVYGTYVEQPPTQLNGGGLNSSMGVGYINIAGNGLEDGQSISVQFLLGIQQTGSYRFYINIEMLNDAILGPPAAPASAKLRKFLQQQQQQRQRARRVNR